MKKTRAFKRSIQKRRLQKVRTYVARTTEAIRSISESCGVSLDTAAQRVFWADPKSATRALECIGDTPSANPEMRALQEALC